MLTEHKIKEAILRALVSGNDGDTNRVFLGHVDGQIRAYLHVLTGEDFGATPTVDTAEVLKAAKIPYAIGRSGRVNYNLPDEEG